MISITAPASPVSELLKSNPQTGHAGRNVSNPLNSLPFPHRGQRQRKAAAKGEIAGSVTRPYSAAI
jgi:hypothetical protein